jgi:hypothetical protein
MVLEPENVRRDFIVSDTRRDVTSRRLAFYYGPCPEEAGSMQWLAWKRLRDHENEPPIVACKARRGSQAWEVAKTDGIPMKPADIEAARVLVLEVERALDTVNRTTVTAKQHAESQAIADAVLSYPPAAAILGQDTTRTEVRLSWTDAATGVECKGYADIVCIWDTRTFFASYPAAVVDAAVATFGHMDGHDVVIDLKTVRDAEPTALVRDAEKMGYHIQGAHYCDGVRDGSDSPVFFGILAVEGAAPHDVGLVMLPQDSLMYSGEVERARMLATIAECRRTGEYPGKVPVPVVADVPEWMLVNDDETETGEG